MSKGNEKMEGVPAVDELVIIRIFDAPVELVWKAWTEPEQLKRWASPAGFTAPFSSIDFRVGGKYLNCMRSPEGKDFWTTGEYLEIIPSKKIVMTDSFADEKGNKVPASYYGMKDFPEGLQVTLIFEETDGGTKMTLRHKGLPAGEMSEMTGSGWNQFFDKLAETFK